MRAIWTLARKEFALLLRDRQATLLLLVMPLLFILVLGMLVGDDFGQQSKLRISLVDLDTGAGPKRACGLPRRVLGRDGPARPGKRPASRSRT